MEYRFRGWDATGQKGWVYGDLTHSKRILQEEPYLEDRVMVGGYEVVPESVGICTGFKDDCGNMLYEGDICRICCYDRLFNAVIRYIDFKGCFYYNSLPIDFVLTTKLIGNVYQNKELLEKEN